ncbi:uncharacterized protein F5Z01DRAFT_632652 [Emericellopsis atlantica]|uniref:Uncharacterized protein n=1 Tax=Emericellopsis atlantica TaxID=2614577 RepID=A0A9P7ZVD6_9HYPO|nr:uncharacterized protein F5Z01DRAFT_632652 [Emericellopsis atlantica]KAG9258577.1 hypothetical protein F5Z01DRAFT_632652 [Emericellopsis atlantica]
MGREMAFDMDRRSKLADLTLVSKYYPVANYSYPARQESAQRDPRTSLGSDISTPRLIDDRSDSEVSADDDYQHRDSAGWESYWRPEGGKKGDSVVGHPRKQYPALIPSPERKREPAADSQRSVSPSWPLPNSPTRQTRTRQPAATYSAFPKPVALPPRARPASPSWESSRPRAAPTRPARPDRLLTPCIQQTSPIAAFFNTLHIPEHFRKEQERDQKIPPVPKVCVEPTTPPSKHTLRQRISSLAARPVVSDELERPKTSHGHQQPKVSVPKKHRSSRSLRPSSPTMPKRSVADRPPTPFESEEVDFFPDLPLFPMPDPYTQQRAIKFHRPKRPEPISVFEDDSDGEDDEPRASFFKFHKRSTSDLRKGAGSRTEDRDPDVVTGRRRGRTSPTPSLPDTPCGLQPPNEKKRDVFGRMLGRRSR